MKYKTSATVSDSMNIHFDASGNEATLQRVGLLFSTPAGTVPFDREYGIEDPSDLPIYGAKAKISTEYVTKIKQYESGVTIEEITFDNDAGNGILKPEVVVSIE